MSILLTDHLYQAPAKYRLFKVKSNAFRTFYCHFRNFDNHIKETEIEEQWRSIIRYFKQFNYICSTTIIAPKDVHNYLVHNTCESLSEDLKRLRQGASEETKVLLGKLMEASRVLMDKANPLRDAYEKFCMEGDSFFYNSRGRGFSDFYQSHIDKMHAYNQYDFEWTAVIATELKGTDTRENLVYFGVPNWTLNWNRNYVLTAPRAKKVNVICFDFYPSIDEPLKLSGFLNDDNFIDYDVVETGDEIDEPIEEFSVNSVRNLLDDSADFALPKLRLSSDMSQGTDEFTEFMDCYHVSLSDGKGLWLGAEAKVRVINTEGYDGDMAVGCGRRKVDDLSEGDIVVVTTEGAGDVTSKLADKILNVEHSWCRKYHSNWKEALRKKVLEIGFERAAERIAYIERKIGSTDSTSNITNLKNWCGERNIGPQNENTLSASVQFAGMEDDLRKISDSVKLIRKAHMKAGGMVARQIRKSVRRQSIRTLLDTGKQHFRLPEVAPDATQTAYIVDQIDRNNKRSVPVALTGILHDVDSMFE